MAIAFRIIIGVAWLVFAFYVGEHDGKTIHGKNITRKEKEYIDFLSIYALLSSLFIVALLLLIIEEI